MLINEDQLKQKFNEVIHGRLNDSNIKIGGFIQEISSLRTGKPNIDSVSKLKIMAYGAPSEIGYISQVYPDGTSICVKSFNAKDSELLKEIESKINSTTEIGGRAVIQEGGVVRINFPPLTEETREENVKILKSKLEEYKIRGRQVRQDAMHEIKKKKDEGGVSEDDVKKEEEGVQKLLDKCIEELDQVFGQKKIELMKI